MTNEHCPPPGPHGYPSDCEILASYRRRADERSHRQDEALSGPLRDRAAAILLLLLDVDGVLTNGSLLYTETGNEAKSFNTQDGLGVKLLFRAGVEVGLITARHSEIVRRRAEELGMQYVYQGVDRKLDAFKEILRRAGRKPFEVCYMGDDWIDLALLTRVGLAACPANGVAEVQAVCHFVTQRGGGQGAVREVCDLIIKAKGVRETLLQQYLT